LFLRVVRQWKRFTCGQAWCWPRTGDRAG